MHHLVFGINFQIHFVSLVSPVSIHLVQLSTHPSILVINATLSIYHSFTLSLKAQNLPLQQILERLQYVYGDHFMQDY